MPKKCVDPDFSDSSSPVIALVEDSHATYVICRGEGAAAQVRQHLQNRDDTQVTSSEAYRIIPDHVKGQFYLSTGSIVKLPKTSLGESILALTQTADGSPSHFLVGEKLEQSALKIASQHKLR